MSRSRKKVAAGSCGILGSLVATVRCTGVRTQRMKRLGVM